ncbi:MAG TPA: Smr/MutS family protein [Chitinophagaceae bacterium]|nr:Smr/MutS family protein [Chitinophagaceae bacterium]
MKFEIGDKIILLHSGEEGEVVELLNDRMVTVDVNGVRFPAYTDQIDFPYYRRFTEKKPVAPREARRYVEDVRKEKPSGGADRPEEGVWLTFLPVMETDEFGDEVVRELKLHLDNRMARGFRFTYRLLFFGRAEFSLEGTLPPFQHFYLHDIPFSDLSDNPGFAFTFSLVEPDPRKAPSLEASFRIRARQLFARIEEIREKNEATFSHRLFDQYPDYVPEVASPGATRAAAGVRPYDASQARQRLEPPRSVIDLHVEKLTDDWRGLSNFEILTLQLQTFEKFLDLAIAHLQPSLIVIHGVGSGRLREEIHELLKLRREVKTFVNQYDPRFGYGATEIFFQY